MIELVLRMSLGVSLPLKAGAAYILAVPAFWIARLRLTRTEALRPSRASQPTRHVAVDGFAR